jgi:cellulose synthase/poly-beta-1,6-N-acetylglucosamine synthase-like glycosyltransferase
LQILFYVFLAAAGIQCIYFLIFSIAFSGKRSVPEHKSPPVSVVVAAHDEEENLRQLLPMLLAQDYPSFEIIIVEDRSNDESYDFLLEETKKHDNVKMVRVQQTPDHINSKKFALTLGIKAAKHEWILLCDADCRPNTNQWIKSMGVYFQDSKQIVLGYSPYLTTPGWLNRFIRFDAIITAVQYVGFALLGMPYMGVGRNLAYRKSLFLENKGFNEVNHVVGGDDDLFVNKHANRKNTAIALGSDTLVETMPKNSWREFFYQKLRHLSVGKYYKASHKIVLSIFTLSWILVWTLGLLQLFFLELPLIVGGILLVRVILITATIQITVKALGDRFEAWPILFLDILYPFYYITTGLAAIFTKKVQWRN